MAVYHKSLKYHEDEVKKHKITEEELQFLQSLQKELNTQDTVSQANPRFWVIKGTEKMYNVDQDDADGFELCDEDSCETLAEDTESICEYINDNLLVEINSNRLEGEEFTVAFEKSLFGNDIIRVTWNDGGDEEFKEDEELSDIDDIHNWLEEQGYDYRVIAYKNVQKIYENTMFLTQIDAENHLRSNYYHYSDDAHTYAMTAWRDLRMDKLIKILQQVDFSMQREIESEA